jgi:hypothetical protein
MSLMKRFVLYLCILTFIISPLSAQKSASEAKLETKLQQFFKTYLPHGVKLNSQPAMMSYTLDNNSRTLDIYADEYFGSQEFTPDVTNNIYNKIRKTISQPYNAYKITIFSNNISIDELIPNRLVDNSDKSRMWGNVEYTDLPWVSNRSRPIKITKGLQNRHLSLWASHGRYYNVNSKKWEWQRPNLFCTCEDLFTQTIVVPYLIPMLQNAGAIVFTPRERDWQKNEIIVDNDNPQKYYMEIGQKNKWSDTDIKGFAYHSGTYNDGDNPFQNGTARMATTVSRESGSCGISYTPGIPVDGKYAVYVSYQTLTNSIPDAKYIVWHKGEKTEFKVNQTMGGSTWVYLGTFDFDQGCDRFNRVTLSNESKYRGVVTADAVRFGGGMGNISRNGETSGLPRCLEGARYYAQWAGMNYNIYSSKNGTDDYGDDINVRSLMTNYLGGGSVYMPSLDGDKVPFELSLAIHSDAGYVKNDTNFVGSLAICTTDFNDGKLNAGISRLASRDLADALLSGVTRDIRFKYGKWNRRELFDRNYSETRNPEVPSTILETMSHQNFTDMRYGEDPNFRFTLARSIYKTLLRYISDQHGAEFIVTPLAPDNFFIDFSHKDIVTLHWSAVNDPQESTSCPNGYIVYTASGRGGFDNGTFVHKNNYSVTLEPGVIYNFRITAVNPGGESFPSETLSALFQPNSTKTILIVNGFHRLSSPAIIDNDSLQGFDMAKDPGVSYGQTAGWYGYQTNFDRKSLGTSLGDGSSELVGTFVAGNNFDYPREHGEAINLNGKYSFVSSSSQAVENKSVNLNKYGMVDLILGLEKDDGHSLMKYKSFSSGMRLIISEYLHNGGSLLASGSFIGSDMTSKAEQTFNSKVLKINFTGSDSISNNEKIDGMGTDFDIYSSLNEEHYAVTSPDILQPVLPAHCVLRYSDGNSACVAYKGTDYRCLTMGFPFECIKNPQKRFTIMNGILNYLLK